MSLLTLPGVGALFSRGAGPELHPVAIQARQAVSATATAVRTAVAVPTAVPVPPAPAPSTNPFDPSYLGQAAQPGLGLLSTLFLLGSAVLLIGGLYFYFVGKNRWRGVNRVTYRAANRWSVVAALLGVLGVGFMIFRLIGLEGLNARFWLYLVLLAMAISAGVALYYFRTRYPAQQAAFQRSQKGRPNSAGRARTAAARPASGANVTTPARPTGSAGNPRGTSARGERRRDKKR